MAINFINKKKIKGVKLFETVEEMQADNTAKEGDLALVYKQTFKNITNETITNLIYFPNNVTLPQLITTTKEIEMGEGADSTYYAELTPTSFEFKHRYTALVKYSSTDGINYVKTKEYKNNPIKIGLDLDFSNTNDVSNWDNNFGYFMQLKSGDFEGIYEYWNNSYIVAETQLTAIPENLYNSIAYSNEGVIEGVLTTNVENTFTDVSAEIYAKIQQAYDNMEPIILTDDMNIEEVINNNVYIIPKKTNGTPLLDTSKVTSMTGMFRNYKNLIAIPLLDTSKVTSMASMFYNCSNLLFVPQLNTNSVTNMYQMFRGCSNLKNIPLLDTSNVTNMNSMFSGCKNLTAIPLLDTSNCTVTTNMFQNCTNLVTIPQLNLNNVTSMGYMYNQCLNLSNESLNNILASISTVTSSTVIPRLREIGLSEAQAQICTTLSNWTTCEAAGWTTGYETT